MELAFTAEENAFREEVRAWIKENLPPDFKEPRSFEERLAFSRAWEKKLSASGWAGIAWPKEYGGRGATLMEQIIFHEEMARARAPQIFINFVGINLAGPTIRIHGTEEQRKRYLPPILSMEEIWCQGFSEPNAGSDLANVQTRADLRDDHFVVNGQKIWTSFAHVADWCLLLCRTDQSAAKHKGLSYLLVDMKSPGIDPRPLKQITGEAEFNEVFFTDCVVPRENLLGELGMGWTYANTTLSHERGPAFLAHQIRYRNTLLDLVSAAKTTLHDGVPATEHPAYRQKLAAAYAELEIMRYLGLRMVTSIMRNGRPGTEGSVSKLYWSHMVRRMQELGLGVTGASAMLDGEDAANHGSWQRGYMMSFAQTIAAGSSEIQKNIISERVLGMPRGEVWAPKERV
ncbi:MAG: acyl-CoA dehydrogenase family protein [Actinomycetota bacterium]|nr:acyl-CoA dehydrogenase family protein [Actinomycetota bacterium]